MSDPTIVDEQKGALVRWDDELAKHAKEVASVERPSLSQISTKSGVMTYQSQQVPGNRLPCVIIASAFEHRFYTGRYDPNKREAPKCFALSISGDNMAPNPEDVREPISSDCDSCPNNRWGSDPNGGKGKACKAVRRLALVPAAVLTDGNVDTAEIALLSVPVTSAKNWANYVNNVAAQYQRPPWAMLTEVSIVPNARTQFEIKFTDMGTVRDEAVLAKILKRIPSVQQILMTPYDQSGLVDGAVPGEEKARKF